MKALMSRKADYVQPFLTSKSLVAALAVAGLALIQTVTAATSVSQFGITWKWNEDRPVGQFANGDWYVVGPITLTGPVSSGGQNGTMINPPYTYWADQGFDSRITPPSYGSSLNAGASLPKVVQPGSSIVSSKGHPVLRNRNQLDDLAVLTVLSSAPPAGSFRPPYLGSGNKTVKYNKSQILYNRLQKLPLVNGANRTGNERLLERTMFNLGSGYTSNYLLGWNNTPLAGKNYGREITLGIALVGLELNLNYTDAQKEKMAVTMVQHGLDYYGGILLGQKFLANGGHQGGRKLAVALAGLLLNDSAILARCDRAAYPDTFAEDTQHFFVTQNDINTPRAVDNDPARIIQAYPQSALGMPEWGPDGGHPKTTAGYNWDRYYRGVCCPNFTGEALAGTLSGLQTAWNHPAFFAYNKDRAIPTYRQSNNINAFILAMHDAYGGSVVPPPIDPPGTVFKIGDTVETTGTTNIRSSGSLSATLVGTQTQGAKGTITAGPVDANSITWWQVNFASGVDGWCGGDNLILSTSPSGPPSAPTGLKVDN